MTTIEYLSEPIFKEYINTLEKVRIPRECYVQDYKQSEAIRRKTIRYYTDCIQKYPLRNIGVQEDKILTIPKTKTRPATLGFVGPLIICAVSSANELAAKAEEFSPIFEQLIESIIVHKMAEDFRDFTIEDTFLWYEMNYMKLAVRKIQRYRNGVTDVLDSRDIEDVASFALASTMYEKYKENSPRMLSSIRKIIVDKSGIDTMLRNYNINLSNPEILETLEKQEKSLTLKIPSKK